MTDPTKPRRKVTSQISLAPSASPSTSTAPQRLKARVDPSSIARSSPSPTPAPGTPAFPRPAARSTPSTLSLRSAPPSARARSPLPPQSSTPTARATRTPGTGGTGTPSLVSRPSFQREQKQSERGTPTTTVPRIRAARSVVDSPSANVTTRTPRTPDIRRGHVGAGAGAGPSTTTEDAKSRGRALSLRSNSGDLRPATAKIRPSTSSSPSIPGTPTATSAPPAPPVPHIPRYTGGSHSVQTPPPQPISSPPHNHVPETATLIPGLGMDDGGLRGLTSTWRNASPERSYLSDEREISSNRSSPTRSPPLPAVTSAQHALAYIFQHPTASAPTSPIPSSSAILDEPPAPRSGGAKPARARLPYHPLTHPPPLPRPPVSPELRTVALPSLTPGGSSEEWSGSHTASTTGTGSGSGTGTGATSASGSESRKFSGSESDLSALDRDRDKKDREDRDRSSGATAVDVDVDVVVDVELGTGKANVSGKEGDAEVDEVLGADAEEAKVNRKVADLEISNASLLAINKMLEATKAKQRSEIIKLRRMLRESIAGYAIPAAHTGPASLTTSSPFGFGSLSLLSPGLDSTFSDTEEGFMDEEMADPHLDARWDKIADLVSSMKRRGESAVERGKEEIKVGPVGRVLGWMEVEKQRRDENQGDGDGDGDDEGQGEGETTGDMTVESIATTELDEDEDEAPGGETSREEVDMVI